MFDLTLANTKRTPASAGLEAVPGTGDEYYAGGQMVDSGIFMSGDTLIGLRIARRTDKFGRWHQTTWRPNLRATYQATRWVAFDAEVGLVALRQRQDDAAFVGRNRERATLINLGYRLTF